MRNSLSLPRYYLCSFIGQPWWASSCTQELVDAGTDTRTDGAGAQVGTGAAVTAGAGASEAAWLTVASCFGVAKASASEVSCITGGADGAEAALTMGACVREA